MSETRLLAIDLGASGGRAMLGRLSSGRGGQMITVEEAHRFDHGPIALPHDAGQTYHWDAVRLWDEVTTGIRKAAHAYGAPASIGVDTWGVDYGLIDASGRLLENPVAHRDARTAGMMARAFQRVGKEEIFRRTGLQFMDINTLYQLMAAVDQRSRILEAADRMLMMPDLFHYWLSGSKAVEYTDASTSQMMGAQSRAWDRELMAQAGVPDRFLPELVEAGTQVGTVRPALADELGLPGGVAVVCPGTHDTASAVVATPAEGDDWAFLSAGTWCLLGAEVARPYLSAEVLDAGFSNEGGVRGTTRLLRNITGLWLVQECRRYWRAQGKEYTWPELARLAADAPPFLAVIDPDDPVFAQPTRMPNAIAEYCGRTGQRKPETPGEFVRVAMEGIALTVRRRWDQLQRILGRELRVLHMVGGGTQNELLCQLVADALGRPVLTGPTEATALGNALMQGVGLGALDYADVRGVVRRSIHLKEYRPSPSGAWDDALTRLPA